MLLLTDVKIPNVLRFNIDQYFDNLKTVSCKKLPQAVLATYLLFYPNTIVLIA